MTPTLLKRGLPRDCGRKAELDRRRDLRSYEEYIFLLRRAKALRDTGSLVSLNFSAINTIQESLGLESQSQMERSAFSLDATQQRRFEDFIKKLGASMKKLALQPCVGRVFETVKTSARAYCMLKTREAEGKGEEPDKQCFREELLKEVEGWFEETPETVLGDGLPRRMRAGHQTSAS